MTPSADYFSAVASQQVQREAKCPGIEGFVSGGHLAEILRRHKVKPERTLVQIQEEAQEVARQILRGTYREAK